jgi:hypothetical protein
MSKPIENYFACDACDTPRLSNELGIGPEAYPDHYFCRGVECGEAGAIDRCDRCGDVYNYTDLTNGGEYDPSSDYCHDCLISESEDRRESRFAESDYRHATR